MLEEEEEAAADEAAGMSAVNAFGLAFLEAGTAADPDPAADPAPAPEPSRKACASGLVTKPLNTAPWKPLTFASHSGHVV